MKKTAKPIENLIYIFPFLILACTSNQTASTINDDGGILGKTNAPVSIEVKLNKNQVAAAREGRLRFLDLSSNTEVPLQVDSMEEGPNLHLVILMPEGEAGPRAFKLIEQELPLTPVMKTSTDPGNGQVIMEEAGEPVLQYNYQTVCEKDVIHLKNDNLPKPEYSRVSGIYFDEYLKSHPKIKKDTLVTTSIYAVPRSDYIHPLFGLEGEMLSRDWPDTGHPHHRGIFWAWPEVKYGSELGDIYALQRVFARPTGKITYTNGPVFAQVVAENLWMWEDSIAIVREQAVIRVYRASSNHRIIDLTIQLDALKDSITIATRFTNSYGGLNLRMQTPKMQDISFFTDDTGAKPLRAWSDFNGTFKGNKSPSGLMVLQHHDNPEYPGAWAEYPGLAWVQPTFPAPGTRYPIRKGKSLVLRYRLIVHAGGKPDKAISERMWDAFHEQVQQAKGLL